MFEGIDLSSDTVTQPSADMKRTMMKARLGDEQRGEDPTTLKLEQFVAKITGLETALFFPSATMANQVAVWSMTEPGDAVLLSDKSHIYLSESGGIAVHARVIPFPLSVPSGKFNATDLKPFLDTSISYHHSRPKMICLENTVNRAGGCVWQNHELSEITQFAAQNKLALHMDGARLFNASIQTNTDLLTICSGFDTVTICLSKGLGCPAGALLAFNGNLYEKVRRLKQMLGGSMRQTGMLAAAGLYALEHNVSKLANDHRHAKIFAEKLGMIPHITVLTDPPDTNIVLFSLEGVKLDGTTFLTACLKQKLRFSLVNHNVLRAVTHMHINEKSVIDAAKIVASILT